MIRVICGQKQAEMAINHETHENKTGIERTLSFSCLPCISWFQNKDKSMSRKITLDEAQANLIDIVHQLEPGEEIVITENGKAIHFFLESTVKASTGA